MPWANSDRGARVERNWVVRAKLVDAADGGAVSKRFGPVVRIEGGEAWPVSSEPATGVFVS